MKKLILLLLATTLFISCDEDALPNSNLGKWYLHKEFVNGVEYSLCDCCYYSSLHLFTDSVEVQTVVEDFENGKCKNAYKTKYKAKNNGTYEFFDGYPIGTNYLNIKHVTNSAFEGYFENVLEVRYEIAIYEPDGGIISINEHIDIYIRSTSDIDFDFD